MSPSELAAFIRDFEACQVPKSRWTHQSHLVVGFWYLTHFKPDKALDIVRDRIRRHNEAVGTENTDSGGYHETITRLYMTGIATHIAQHGDRSPAESLAILLASPLGNSAWPLTRYSKELLFSVGARRHWVEPDLLARD